MLQPADVRVLFLGCGDLGTGAAHRLHRVGFRVAIVELSSPLAVRRRVAFAEAARSGEVAVEGVRCRRLELERARAHELPAGAVALFVAPIEAVVAAFAPQVVVDARMAKRPQGPALPAGLLRVALGPGHVVGRDCDAVVETLRGPDLGRVLWEGSAHPDTGVPGEVGGATCERVLRAPVGGVLRLVAGLGSMVQAGEPVAAVDGVPVRSEVGGLVRGLLADGDRVEPGQKLGDIDPRPDAPALDRISDKAHAVAEGVLTAILQRLQIALPRAP